MSVCVLAFAAVFLPAAPTAAAPAAFEGRMHMKVGTQEGLMNMTVLVAPTRGIRNEMELPLGDVIARSVVIFRRDKKAAWVIDDDQKTYTEVTLAIGRGQDAQRTFTTRTLAPERVNGWQCRHTLLTDDLGNETEVWTSSEIADYRWFMSTMGDRAPAGEAMVKALEKIGAAGFIVKLVARPKAQAHRISMELVKVERGGVPPSLFEVPSGYKQVTADASGLMFPPEAQERVLDELKNLTPEQREAVKKAMEDQGR